MKNIILEDLLEKSRSAELQLSEKLSVLLLENNILPNNAKTFSHWEDAFNADKDFNAMIDRVLGYQDLMKLENERDSNKVKYIIDTIGDWSTQDSDGCSSYADIKSILRSANLQDEGLFVDIGSSYGRVGNVLGANFPKMQFLGYEFVEDRVNEAQRVANLLGLKNVKYEQVDFLSKSFTFPKADYFFLYNTKSKKVCYLRIVC